MEESICLHNLLSKNYKMISATLRIHGSKAITDTMMIQNVFLKAIKNNLHLVLLNSIYKPPSKAEQKDSGKGMESKENIQEVSLPPSQEKAQLMIIT